MFVVGSGFNEICCSGGVAIDYCIWRCHSNCCSISAITGSGNVSVSAVGININANDTHASHRIVGC